MGLGNSFVVSLTELKRRDALAGISSVIEIGAQQLSNGMLRETAPTDELFRLYGRPLPRLGADHFQGTINGLEHQPENAPDSRAFWESLGFTYSALDFDGHRDSIAIDLNQDTVPRSLKGRFDLVVNTGTTEHVTNQDNAFRVIHDLVRPGGIMMHELPAQGMMMHGLFNYNPKFFWHLCRENSYTVLFLKVCSEASNPIPAEILDSNIQHSGHQYISIETVPDFTIRAAFRKNNPASPFVTPLDLPAEVKMGRPAKGWLNRMRGALFG